MPIPRVSLPIVTSVTADGRRAIALVLVGAALTALNGCARKDAAEIDTDRSGRRRTGPD